MIQFKESLESFVAPDGVKINYLRFVPEDIDERGKAPGICFQPGNRCTADHYRWICEAIAREGYVVYDIHPRGYGSGTPAENDRGGPIQQADFRQLLDILREDPNVDPARIAIGGHSNGGHITLRTAALDDAESRGVPPLKGVFALSQVADWARFVGGAKYYYPDYYELIVEEFGGAPEENPQPYLDRSSVHLADKIKCPVFNLVGDDDTTCPPHLTRSMYEALLASGNDKAELFTISEVGHFYEKYSFDGYKLEETAMAVVDFLKRTI